MPEEFSRTTKVKTVTLPNSVTVKIPVITKVSFIDQFTQYQEYQYEVDNSAEADRRVHVIDLHPSGNQSATPIQVERLEIWKHTDQFSQYQETQVEFDNINGETNNPPSFDIANGGSHLKTHTVKYYHDQNDKNSNWVQVEYVDEIDVIDPMAQHQESIFTLTNPTQEDADAMDLDSDPDITDPNIDPPYRTDPFLNIVDFASGTAITLRWIYIINSTIVPLPNAGDTGVCDIEVDPGSSVVGQYGSEAEITLIQSPTPPPGFTIGGAPSVTPDSFSHADWEFLGSPFFTPGLHVNTSTSTSISDLALVSLGVGFYGDTTGGPGIFGGAISTSNAGFGTVSINAASVTLTPGGPAWTRTYAEISIDVSGFTITQVFSP